MGSLLMGPGGYYPESTKKDKYREALEELVSLAARGVAEMGLYHLAIEISAHRDVLDGALDELDKLKKV